MFNKSTSVILCFLFIVVTSKAQLKLQDNLGSSIATTTLNASNHSLYNVSSLVIGSGSLTTPYGGIVIQSNKVLSIPVVPDLLGAASPIPLANTINGMVVFDNLTKSMYIRQNSQWQKFLPSNLSPAQIFIGNSSNQPVARTVTGDIAIDNSGRGNIQPSAVTTSSIIDGTIKTDDIKDAGVLPANIKTSGIAGQVLTTSGSPLTSSWVSKTVPFKIGQMKFSAQLADHNGWLICNGRSLSRTVYSGLFAVISTAFGFASSTTFNLPSMGGMYMGGIGTGAGLSARAVGSSIGSETVKLVVSNLPSHSHPTGRTSIDGSHTHQYQIRILKGDGNGYDVFRVASPTGQLNYSDPHAHSVVAPLQGSSLAFNSYQPTLFVGNCFIYSGVQ